MSSLSSTCITSALEQLKSDAGLIPHRFHSNFNRRLIGVNSLQWIHSNSSNIISTPAGHQSLNVLPERTWRILIQMARAFVTEDQAGQESWYLRAIHVAMMMK